MRRARATLAWTVCAACTLPAQPRPIPDSTQGTWVAARTAEDSVSAVVGTSTSAWYVTGLRGDETLWALTYSADPSTLGLSSGLLEVSLPCQRSCALLSPSNVYRAEGPAWAWAAAALDDAPSPLRALLVPDGERCASPCGRASVRDVFLSSTAEAMVVEPYRGDALVGTEDGHLHRLDVEAATTEELCGGLAGMESSAIVDDRLYLAWSEVQVVELPRIVRGADCPIVDRIPFRPDQILRSILVVSERPTRMFATTSSGAVVRFDGAQWTEEARLRILPNDVGSSGTRQGALVRLRDGTIVASVGSDELWVVPPGSGGHLERVVLEGKPQRIRAMADSPTLGLVLASDDVGILVRRGGGWARLDGSHWSLPGLLLPLGDTLVLSAFVSVVVPIVPGFGECPALTSVGLGVARRGAVMSSSTAVILDNRPQNHHGEPPSATILRLSALCPGDAGGR